jgi:hypothetical protein
VWLRYPQSPRPINYFARGPQVISSVGDCQSIPYLDPQLGTGHPCTRTSSVLYFLIRYLDPKVQ